MIEDLERQVSKRESGLFDHFSGIRHCHGDREILSPGLPKRRRLIVPIWLEFGRVFGKGVEVAHQILEIAVMCIWLEAQAVL